MPEPARPLGTDDADDLRLYLEAAAREPLLTKEEEVELAMLIEHGKEAEEKLRSGRLGAEGRPQGGGRPAALHHGEPSPRRVRRPQVPGPGTSVAGPHPGGEHRPDARRRAVRLAPRLQVLDLCDMVDPPGHHPGDRGPLAVHPPAGS